MKSEIETLGPCKLKVKIEIPPDEVRSKIEEKFREVRANVALPGFRKGHVPRNILEKRFGKTVENDAKMDLIEGSIAATIKEKKIAAVGDPDLDPEKIEFGADKPMAFELTVETKPDVKPKDYLGVAATRKKAEASEEDLAKALDRLAASRAEWVAAETVGKDDMVIADLSLKMGEETVMSEADIRVIAAEDLEVLHAPAPQVYQALLGAKAGETRAAEVTAPETHQNEKIRGKALTFSATLKEVKHLNKPEITDEWAKSLDYESLAKLKEDLGRRVQADKEAQAGRETEQQIVDDLLKRHDIPLPEALLQKFAVRSEQRMRLELEVRGVPAEEAEKVVEKERSGSREELEKMLRTHFLLEAIGTKERIFVTEDEVAGRLEKMAMSYGQSPDEVRARLEERGEMTELRTTLREEKIRRFLKDKAKITEA
ncbi:MAG: trigger factor [Candidatus Brocadiae bacterium]|nr:trigger factor [Candidatus Brocadiia bacterium]